MDAGRADDRNNLSGIPIFAIARRLDYDVLFATIDPSRTLAVVKRAWRGRSEPDPRCPFTSIFEDGGTGLSDASWRFKKYSRANHDRAVPSLTLLVLKTQQVEALLAFYQTLVVELVEERHGGGPVHHARRLGNLICEVYPIRDGGSTGDSTTWLGFAVDDLTGTIDALEKSGCPPISPPEETP